MTLRNLVELCIPHERITTINSALSELKVRDFEDFCFFALKKYFLSEKFLTDQEEIRLDYDEQQYHGFNSYLFLTRDEEGIFRLNISHDEADE